MSTPNLTTMKKLPQILAVDFDGTLVSEAFPQIGLKNENMFEAVLNAQNSGIKCVLWTCRNGQELQNAVDYCIGHGFTPDAVNRNVDEVIEMFGHDTRKIFADWYLDDKSLMLGSFLDCFGTRKGLYA